MSEQDSELNLYLIKVNRCYIIFDYILCSIIASFIIISTVCHVLDLYYLAQYKQVSYEPVFSVIIAVSAAIMFVLTVTSDPGTVPRALTPEYPPDLETTRHTEMVKGRKVYRTWCRFCYILRPLRTVHCLRCHRCVMRFDHHCAWLGNCIGLRNYRYYIWFLFWAFWIEVWYATISIGHILFKLDLNEEQFTVGRFFLTLGKYPSAIVLFSIFGLTATPVSCLLLQHLYLASSEFTMKERLDMRIFFAHMYGSPYKKENILRNCGFILCGPMFPSLTGSRFSCCKRLHYERPDPTMPFNVLYPPMPPPPVRPPPVLQNKNYGPHDHGVRALDESGIPPKKIGEPIIHEDP